MKKVILIFILIMSSLQAKELKAVYDCKIGDFKVIEYRLNSILNLVKRVEDENSTANFAIAIHSYCTPIVKEKKKFASIQEKLELLNLAGVKIKLCSVAMSRFGYKQEDIFDFVEVVPTSSLEIIKLQNDGFAYMEIE